MERGNLLGIKRKLGMDEILGIFSLWDMIQARSDRLDTAKLFPAEILWAQDCRNNLHGSSPDTRMVAVGCLSK